MKKPKLMPGYLPKEIMEHKLKIKTEYLANIMNKSKTSEVRYNDRDYQVGDTVQLFEFHNSGTSIFCSASYKISHIHSGLGLQDNWVILSFKKIINEV